MTTSPTFSMCVYCGSRPGENPAFADAARSVGTWIGQRGGQLVYGGGRSGLMGTVAEATRQAGGRVVGVIPQALVDKELANRLCDELHIVQTMHERKAMMAERSDTFLALPGGIGTFEELFEVWTWRQLGYHDKPLGLLNVAVHAPAPEDPPGAGRDPGSRSRHAGPCRTGSRGRRERRAHPHPHHRSGRIRGLICP